MIQTIYVDMDGVLCDFHKRFLELYAECPEIDYPSKKKEKEAFKSQFKDFIKTEQFVSLDPMPDFNEGIEFLKSLESLYTIKILSSTAQEKYWTEISKQKRQWLKKYDISYEAIFVPGKKFKCIYANPYRLLIDDTKSNIVEWNERSGYGILHTSWKQSINEIEKIL